MVRRSLLIITIFVTLGCRPGPLTGDDVESHETTHASESSDDPSTESTAAQTESESSESESDESDGSSDTSDERSCGDGLIDGREQCEGDNLDGFTCLDLGYTGGTLGCDPILCTFDASECAFFALCGNGAINVNESCDGDDLAGLSCTDFGFVAGALACGELCSVNGKSVECSPACQFDVSDCLVEGEASPCTSEANCSPSAPICTAGACWDGGEGDPCLASSDCMPGFGCINGECRDGSEGDPCTSDADCAGSGQCAFGLCFSGRGGSPCAKDDDCIPTYFCDLGYCTTL